MELKGPKPPKILYKYLGPSRCDFLVKRRLRFTPPSAFNDPFDCRAMAIGRAMEMVSYPARLSFSPARRARFVSELTNIDRPEGLANREPDSAGQSAAGDTSEGLRSFWFRESSKEALSETVRKAFENPLKAISPGDAGDGEAPADFVLPAGPSAPYGIPEAWPDLPPGFNDEGHWLPGRQDPYDAIRKTIFQLHGGYTKQAMLDDLGILSLSERANNPLMWSHYTDSHRGLAIGLFTDHYFLNWRDARNVLVPSTSVIGNRITVEYQQVPPLCKVMYVDRHVSMLRTDPASIIAASEYEVLAFGEFLFKSKVWSYEREWRAFRRLTNEQPRDRTRARNAKNREGFRANDEGFTDAAGEPVVTFDVPKQAIAEILIGLRMSVENRRTIASTLLQDPELAHVRLRVARSTSRYGIAFESVKPEVLLSSLEQASYALDEPMRDDLREALGYFTVEQLRLLLEAGAASELDASNVPVELLQEVAAEMITIRQAQKPRKRKGSRRVPDPGN